MKISNTLALAGAVLLAAGCAQTKSRPASGTGTTAGGQVISSPAPVGSAPATPPSQPPVVGQGTSATPAPTPAPGAPVNPPVSQPSAAGQGTAAASQVGTEADRALADLVRGQFNRYGDLAALAPNVHVSAQNGTVTLTGSVPSEQEKRMIDAMVQETSGVVAVNDQLQVSAQPTATGPSSPTTSTTPPGSTTPTTPTTPVGPSSSTNTVSGNVPTAVPGEIFNLHVQGLNPTDQTLAQRIMEGLRTDTSLASMFPNVNINVANGAVTLHGTVQSEQQQQAIASAVQKAAGVDHVDNQLQVQTAQAP